VMSRFDMDALRLSSKLGADYASATPESCMPARMIGHTAVGLTVARLLSGMQDEIAGTVKLIFQPAEEGWAGADRMIKEGALENPETRFCFRFAYLERQNHSDGWEFHRTSNGCFRNLQS